jgi:hypothetical protein
MDEKINLILLEDGIHKPYFIEKCCNSAAIIIIGPEFEKEK